MWGCGFSRARDCKVFDSKAVDSIGALFALPSTVCMASDVICTGGRRNMFLRALVERPSSISFSGPGRNIAPSVRRASVAPKRRKLGVRKRRIGYSDCLEVYLSSTVDNLPLAFAYFPSKWSQSVQSSDLLQAGISMQSD